MARQLMDSMKIPIGLINNAVGCTPISFHQKYKGYATDLNTSTYQWADGYFGDSRKLTNTKN